MLNCLVPTDRERVDYRLYIKNKRDYDIAVASGVGWVAYYNLPVDWRVAEKEIEEYQVNLNLEDK
jgi:hypothetical protein